MSDVDMRRACKHAACMGNVQIRNVPDDVHRTLKARAAREGQSLSEYLLRELEAIAEKPTMEELIERMRALERLSSDVSAVEVVRAGREERERELERGIRDRR